MKTNEEIKILIVDDEESIVNFLTMGLEAEGFKVFSAYDGKHGVALAKELEPNIVILDIMMPELDGYEACRLIKQSVDTSIIMLTAKEEVDDRVRGLEIGADDYMIKPFSFRELVARIQARLRSKESKKEVAQVVTLGKFKVNEEAHEIHYKDQVLELSPTEYKLLKYLLDHKGIVLSKTKILDNVWGYDFYGDENVVEVYIRYLRNKLGDKEHKVIGTVRCVGYRVNIDED